MAKKKKSKGVEQTQTVEQPKLQFSCRNCGHDQGTVFGRNPSTDYAGVTPDGRQYTRVDRYRFRCDRCQQPQVVFQHV